MRQNVSYGGFTAFSLTRQLMGIAMKLIVFSIVTILCMGSALPAFAYALRCNSDGTSCEVVCDSGTVVGIIYWNGENWTDGIRADKDKNVVAKKIVEANGSACQ